MTDSRAAIVASIQQSLKSSGHLPVAPQVTLAPPAPPPDPTVQAETFAAELTRLSGTFLSMPVRDVAPWLAAFLRDRKARELLSWSAPELPVPGLLGALCEHGIDVLDGRLPGSEPDRSQALARIETATVGLTGADAAFADSGTLALWSGPGRPRLASLSVRTHVALLDPRRLFRSWAAWLQAEGSAAAVALTQHSNLSLISGPSRTGDIEMTLTVGVHGPGQVIVILLAGDDGAPADDGQPAAAA